ncbi:MAG: hypothetical protein WCS99_16815 [Limisphaerales bacterium]
MRRALILSGAVVGLVVLVLLVLAYHYRGERYEIVHTAFLSTTNQEALLKQGTVCYSNKELKDAVQIGEFLDQAGMKSFNLDETNLIACVISNYTVERVVGRQNFGLILVQKSATNGISFTVFRGKKRMLQFNYQDAR